MRKNSSRGVSFIEAAVIIPLGLLIAIALFDLGTLGFVKVMLEFGASAAAREAVNKEAIKANTTMNGCTANAGACAAFTGHLDQAGQAADRYLRWAASPSGTDDRRTLIPMRMFDPGHYQGSSWVTAGIPEMGRDFAILRPGEGMLMQDRSAAGGWTWKDHELRPFGSRPGQGWPNPGERWDDVLKRFPISANICARVSTFMLGTFTVCGEQYAYYLGAATASGPTGPVCPNASCETGETCSSCPQDCGACPAGCGDGACNGSETCETCPADCGACVCGDGVCQNNGGGETSFSCCRDCGGPGDGVCCSNEGCITAPGDCGCPINSACSSSTGQCECTPSCPPDYCGDDGCGGYCQCPVDKVCMGTVCRTPLQCGNGIWEAGEECEEPLDCCPPSQPMLCVGANVTCDDCKCSIIPRCNGGRVCAVNNDCVGLICPPNQIPRCTQVGPDTCCVCRPMPPTPTPTPTPPPTITPTVDPEGCRWRDSGDGWVCGGTCPPQEECRAASTTDQCRCRPIVTEPSCGNGIPEQGEECGDGQLVCPPKDGMMSVCQNCLCVYTDVNPADDPVCGNDIAEQGEECNDGPLACPPVTGFYSVCENCKCTYFDATTSDDPVCGNGFSEQGEQCGEPELVCPPITGKTAMCSQCLCSYVDATGVESNANQDTGEVLSNQ